ncbi:glycosyl hydrolase family 92 [Nonlabens tegetincola]|uniref:GH92 family glycosyl hydrolase n=1 Tax=Nonlabens tegetincola TaxID=323273 RepID=UPI000A20418C|nr:GH92 family glycosyl hydrolase [Nonlabens tegetincola]ARN70955.1 glycosyl hydrolase family 92 [Nonlabens tegetincola]
MKKLITLFGVALLFVCCKEDATSTSAAYQSKELTSFVNPFIGTGGHGHTYPGATMPFGMMQLSPDTRLDGWDGCSGYHYSDNKIYGFSHTHLSGTGVSDYGDILLMPTREPILNNGADGEKGYRSSFSHDNEKASPGYYEVHLDDTNIDVRLTVTERAGIHEYRFRESESNQQPDNHYVILDLLHRDKLLEHDIQFLSNTEIQGKRFSSAWATKQMLFFYMKTSHPIKNWNTDYEVTPKVMALEFDNPNNEPITIKIGISPVDEAGARRNLETEIGDKSFDEIRQLANETWEKELSKIVVEDDNENNLTNFYTSLYHTMIAPNLYQDVDGRYRGMDLEIHQSNEFNYYTVFSMWDTYRAAHPLYTIIDEKRTNDFVNTMLAKYDEGSILPIWDLSGNYTGCMIGYHGVPIIADAYMKGIKDYDVNKAYEAMRHSAMQDKLGLKHYKSLGYIPVEQESESVSKTLEYAYDDWTLAQVAKDLGKTKDYKLFTQRAQNYKNLYNPATGFFQGRQRNTWFSPFKPEEVNFNYTEANAWQYSLYAPQDISGHIELMGGEEAYEEHLDQMFSAPMETSGRHQADITGLIGQYAHGNEPSHHMAYLYNFVGKPHKTQEKVHEILTTLYTNEPDGISGNEDCGQMSAWYVLSSLGFYPVTPGSNDYIIGTPLFDKATIHLENGNKLTIIKKGSGKYIASVDYAFAKAELQPHTQSFITHEQINSGGTLVFTMSEEPTDWAVEKSNRPKSAIDEYPIVTAPFLEKGSIAFTDSTVVQLNTLQSNAQMFYMLGDSSWKEYSKPITIYNAGDLTVISKKDGASSPAVTTTFYKYNKDIKITLNHSYANEYSAGGNDALINGMQGTEDFRSGAWQGTQGENLDVTIDLGESRSINSISPGFLKDQRSWIFYPKDVTFEFYDENNNLLKKIFKMLPETGKKEESAVFRPRYETLGLNKVRYIRMKATTYGKLPEWHLGYPYDGEAWIFTDEIVIN